MRITKKALPSDERRHSHIKCARGATARSFILQIVLHQLNREQQMYFITVEATMAAPVTFGPPSLSHVKLPKQLPNLLTDCRKKQLHQSLLSYFSTPTFSALIPCTQISWVMERLSLPLSMQPSQHPQHTTVAAYPCQKEQPH
jgi:hypothetical protein